MRCKCLRRHANPEEEGTPFSLMVHDLRWRLKTQVAVPRLPIVAQMFIVNIINQHLDLCLLVRGHGVRLPTSRAAGRKELDTNGEDSGSGWKRYTAIQFIHHPHDLTKKLHYLPILIINGNAATPCSCGVDCVTTVWHHSWLSSSFPYFKQQRTEWSVRTWPLCGCIGGKLRDGHLSISSNCSNFMWYTCDCMISTHDLAQKCAARNHVDYI